MMPAPDRRSQARSGGSRARHAHAVAAGGARAGGSTIRSPPIGRRGGGSPLPGSRMTAGSSSARSSGRAACSGWCRCAGGVWVVVPLMQSTVAASTRDRAAASERSGNTSEPTASWPTSATTANSARSKGMETRMEGASDDIARTIPERISVPTRIGPAPRRIACRKRDRAPAWRPGRGTIRWIFGGSVLSYAPLVRMPCPDEFVRSRLRPIRAAVTVMAPSDRSPRVSGEPDGGRLAAWPATRAPSAAFAPHGRRDAPPAAQSATPVAALPHATTLWKIRPCLRGLPA